MPHEAAVRMDHHVIILLIALHTHTHIISLHVISLGLNQPGHDQLSTHYVYIHVPARQMTRNAGFLLARAPRSRVLHCLVLTKLTIFPFSCHTHLKYDSLVSHTKGTPWAGDCQYFCRPSVL
jgi:hypothetical protein